MGRGRGARGGGWLADVLAWLGEACVLYCARRDSREEAGSVVVVGVRSGGGEARKPPARFEFGWCQSEGRRRSPTVSSPRRRESVWRRSRVDGGGDEGGWTGEETREDRED
jgi:hypothetical protein